MSLGLAYAPGLGLELGDRDSIDSWLCSARIRPVVPMLGGIVWFRGGPLLGRMGVGVGVVVATGVAAVIIETGTGAGAGVGADEGEEEAVVVVAAAAAAATAEDDAPAAAFLVPPGLGVLPSSLHSGQARMTSLTVSLMRLQWYFSAMVAVVLLMPP